MVENGGILSAVTRPVNVKWKRVEFGHSVKFLLTFALLQVHKFP